MTTNNTGMHGRLVVLALVVAAFSGPTARAEEPAKTTHEVKAVRDIAYYEGDDADQIVVGGKDDRRESLTVGDRLLVVAVAGVEAQQVVTGVPVGYVLCHHVQPGEFQQDLACGLPGNSGQAGGGRN